MEVTINTLTDCDREVEISLTPEELVPHFEQAYKKASPSIEIKGFRKGKAPLSLIKKMYGDSIEYDALDNIANDLFKKTIEERNIQPIGTPNVVDMKYKRGEPFTFKIKYEIKPDFEVKEYKGIAVEKKAHRVTAKDVEAEVERLRHSNATYEEAQKVNGSEFTVTADLQDLDETGAPLIGKKSEGMKIYLNETETEEEIKKALAHAEVGGVYTAKFKHQHDGHSHDVHLQMTVKKIEKVILPEFNDELVKKVTKEKYSSPGDFRKGIGEDLQRYWDEQSETQFVNDLTREIVRRHDFAVPESLVNGFIDTYIEDAKNQQPNKRLPKNFDEEKYREQLRPTAIWQAKWALIKEKILKQEKIEVSDAEIQTMAETESAKLGIDKDRLVQYYKSSENALDRIISEKLLELLKKSAVVKVVENSDAA
ncbi:MAG: trigger factor [Bacteroidota bacterium]|nr:trigger factor [Bacteroidota bacterium]